ncbi:MAG: TlpA family protein disulfide reductase [Ignavibacteriales bacterium]|nr:MAG: TlpA family protein disulfide reductase [Ignavibacteriales bacterium]
MKSNAAIILLLFLFSTITFAQDDLESTTLLKVGNNLPSFTTQSLSGKTFSSDELKGKVVLINFWATWCPPCKAELPLLQKNICEKINNKNFFVLAISRGEAIDTVKKFINKFNYTFPVYLDKDTKVYKLFASKYIPRNFVISKNGKVKMATVGFNKEEFEKMIRLIEKELKN